MKYVFFGTPRFAEIVLAGLLDVGMAPMALVCNPDRPVGRKQIITAPPTKQLILDRGATTAILQPEKINHEIIGELQAMQADFFLVAAYAQIIPDSVLGLPRLGTLGTHPSLLPLYRGASPIQSVILAGEKMTGSTIYAMDAKVDHGPILAQKTIELDALKTNYETLEEQLARLSSEILIAMIPQFLEGKIQPQIQDDAKATFTQKFKTQDGYIEETDMVAAENGDTQKAEEIIRKIHALNPEPGVWTFENGKRMKLLEATLTQTGLKLSKIQFDGETPKSV